MSFIAGQSHVSLDGVARAKEKDRHSYDKRVVTKFGALHLL